MNSVIILTKRELRSYFSNPLTYILGALFSFLLGVVFFNSIVAFSEQDSVTFSSQALRPIFGHINSLFFFILPLMTMKLFSEEKKQQSLDLLMSSPLKISEILASKFLSAMMMCLFLLSLTLVYPLILKFTGFNRWDLFFTGYLGILLMAGFYISIGLFASSLTSNQMVAATVSISIILAFFLIGWSGLQASNYFLSQIMSYLGPFSHFEAFSRGTVRSYDVLYFVSLISFFSILTKRSLEAKYW